MPGTLVQLMHESFNAIHALALYVAPAEVRYDAPTDHGRPDDDDDDDDDGDSGPMPDPHSVTFSPPVVLNANGPDSDAIDGGKYDIVTVDEDQSLH